MAGLVMLWLIIERVCPNLRKKTSDTVQWQLTNGELGDSSGIPTVIGGGAPYPDLCTLPQNHAHMFIDPNAYQGKILCDCQCAVTVVWKQPQVDGGHVYPILNCSPCLILIFLCQHSNLGPSIAQIAWWLCDFRLADEAFPAGQLEMTTNTGEMHWQIWCACVKHLGMNLFLQQVSYATQVQCHTGFTALT